MTSPKFCKDCRWHVPESMPRSLFRRKQTPDPTRARCSNPSALRDIAAYLVAGVIPVEAMPFCRRVRIYEDKHLCGEEAKLFEPRTVSEEAWEILQKSGRGNAPVPGDEVPAGWKRGHE